MHCCATAVGIFQLPVNFDFSEFFNILVWALLAKRCAMVFHPADTLPNAHNAIGIVCTNLEFPVYCHRYVVELFVDHTEQIINMNEHSSNHKLTFSMGLPDIGSARDYMA